MPGDNARWWDKLRRMLPARQQLRRVPLRSMTTEWLEVQHMLTRTQAAAPAYEFDRAECNVLVVYALVDGPEDPTPYTPSFVYGFTPERGRGVLAAQRAPDVTVVDLTGIQRDITSARHITVGARAVRDNLAEMLAWVEEIGECSYAYLLEPPSICGDGTARARGIEWMESAQASALVDEVDLPSTDRWPRAGDDYQCPVCSSMNTRSRFTEAIGNRFTEAWCNTCGHYGSWFGRD